MSDPPRPRVVSPLAPARPFTLAERRCPDCGASFAQVRGRYDRERLSALFRCAPHAQPKVSFGLMGTDVGTLRRQAREREREGVAVRVRTRHRGNADDGT
jgi:hypothetical protein